MRFFSTVLNLAVAATFSSAMPVDSSVSDTPTAPVDWYQGVATFTGTSAVIDASGSCATKVSSGTMTAGGCQKLSTYAFGLHHTDRACNYRLWTGNDDCSGDDYTDIPIPADSNVTCVNDGVLDGGRFYHASGIYSCE
ncbi:hypothetical protein UCDDA912_g06886 [Diaporthe ampelina]|uniref:Uncharacterized protein n=1 Tax=Diaporthe ampelina TaxID=1214573 RepID=A0A0G2FF30_9PEZI|nr:hypothetical protein UCDDA912_g06886 [Diaporthe ampelina]